MRVEGSEKNGCKVSEFWFQPVRGFRHLKPESAIGLRTDPSQPKANPSQPKTWLIRPLADFGGLRRNLKPGTRNTTPDPSLGSDLLSSDYRKG
jgi:hypothetical protein